MNTRLFGIGALAVAAAALGFFTLGPSSGDVEPLALGSALPMPNHVVVTTTGEDMTLKSAAGENGLLVIFSCNTCPWVKKWEDRYLTIAEQAKASGIGVIALNSNEAQRSGAESRAAMKERAEQVGYQFPYAVDKDHKLADAFGASRTPDIFLFSSDLVLQYRGAIDDNARDASAVEEAYLSKAMTQMVAGEEITTRESKSIGCTIKRKSA